MKSLLAVALLTAVLDPLSAQVLGSSAARPEASLVISRSGDRAPVHGSPLSFTGTVTVDYLFAAEDPKRASDASDSNCALSRCPPWLTWLI